MSAKLNGFISKWGKIIIFALILLYNTIVTQVTLKNDVKHQGNRITRLEQKVETLTNYLMEHK